MPKYCVSWSHPTVIVYESEVEASSYLEAIDVAIKNGQWKQIEMNPSEGTLCHICNGDERYDAKEVE